MPKATWNGVVLAESDDTVVVEGNHYFPPESVSDEYFKTNDRTSVCSWKGEAKYYDVVVEDSTNPSSAWTYHEPSDAAKNIKDYVAFYPTVTVK